MTPVDDRRALAPYYEAAEDEVEADEEPWDAEFYEESDYETYVRLERSIARMDARREQMDGGRHARGR